MKKDCDKSPHERMNCVILFLQHFLSSVEVLELIDCEDVYEVPYIYNIRIAYVILYNIVTSSQPSLKHLKYMHGIPFVSDWGGLELIFELFLKTNASSLPDPYPLEDLSVLVPHWHWRYSTILSSLFTKLLKQPQFHALSVGKSPLSGACALIETFLTTPASHKQTLCVEGLDCDKQDLMEREKGEDKEDNSTNSEDEEEEEEEEEEQEEQNLMEREKGEDEEDNSTSSEDEEEEQEEQDLMEREKGEDEEDNSTSSEDEEEEEEEDQEESTGESDEDIFVVKRRRITCTKPRKELPERIIRLSCSTWSHNIPETNAQFKCLDLGHSSSCIHSLLFSLPELKLKKLRMRTQDMTLVLADTAIKVEHVVFSTQTHTSYKLAPVNQISPAHLEKFIISNPVLKRLQFEYPTDECAPGLIPALIHCLSKLYQQGRGLDELVLDSIKFDDIDIREFFTTMRHLSHQHGTTLVLTPPEKIYYLFPWYEEEASYFVDLGKEFQETKIKKIVCNVNYRCADPRPQLSPLAEEVVVNYRRCFFTKSGRECCL